VESPLGQADVASLEISLRFETAIALDPTVGSPSNLYRSSGRRFPWSRCGIPTWSGGRRVARDQLTGLKGP
jgi:hypothetical protein